MLLASVHWHRGAAAEAARVVREDAVAARRRDDAHMLSGTLMWEGASLLRQDRGAEALAVLEESAALAERARAFVERHLTAGVLCLARLREGDPARAALEATRTARGLGSQMPTAVYSLEGYAGPAEVLVTLAASRPALLPEAREAVRALRLFARTFPVARSRALCFAARLALVEGATRRAEAQGAQALSEAVRLGLPYDEACARELLGELRRDPEELTRARTGFAAVGAEPERRRAGELLQRG